MQARFKHHIARFSQGERRRARFEQARLIALHSPDGGELKAPRLRLASRVALWLHSSLFMVLMLAALSGCSAIKGVAITEGERKACEAASCTVWTEKELNSLARHFFQQGYSAGVKSL